MAWLEDWLPYLPVGTTLFSAVIAFALCQLRWHPLLAVSIGGTAPALAFIAITFYLDSQLPEGVFYLFFGIALGPAIMVFGLLGAAFVTILSKRLQSTREDNLPLR